jgi:hypothetical protein
VTITVAYQWILPTITFPVVLTLFFCRTNSSGSKHGAVRVICLPHEFAVGLCQHYVRYANNDIVFVMLLLMLCVCCTKTSASISINYVRCQRSPRAIIFIEFFFFFFFLIFANYNAPAAPTQELLSYLWCSNNSHAVFRWRPDLLHYSSQLYTLIDIAGW